MTDPQGFDWRTDPLTGQPVVLVPGRQDRPSLPDTGCPFCPGGVEAPEPYQVRWFPNRWAALEDDHCELVLFSPDHDACLGGLEKPQMLRVIRLWTERCRRLGSRPEVAYVLLFENRGAQVGATITHPHGQIYAFREVPPAARLELRRDGCAVCEELAGSQPAGQSHPSRLVVAAGGWRAWTTWAPSWPYELLIATEEHLPDLPSAEHLDEGLGRVLAASLSGLDQLFEAPVPYMLWCHQRPSDGGGWPAAHLHLHVAPVWRGRRLVRYVAAAELGSGVMFNPVDPQQAAQQLRATLAVTTAAGEDHF